MTTLFEGKSRILVGLRISILIYVAIIQDRISVLSFFLSLSRRFFFLLRYFKQNFFCEVSPEGWRPLLENVLAGELLQSALNFVI